MAELDARPGGAHREQRRELEQRPPLAGRGGLEVAEERGEPARVGQRGGVPAQLLPGVAQVAQAGGEQVDAVGVQMADLRARFSELGFTNVETFIASGNVIFETDVPDPAELQAQIEHHLHRSLGYAVPTFLRSPRELATVAAARPFTDPLLDTGAATLSIMFTDVVLPPELHDQLRPFETAMDAFHVAGREIFWLCRGKTTESLVDWPVLGNVVPLPPMTVRNATTVRKLAAKYPPRR